MSSHTVHICHLLFPDFRVMREKNHTAC